MAETPRLKALRNLAANLPSTNPQIANGMQAARDMQVQAAVAKAPASTNVTQAAQQTGTAVAGQAGQQQIQNAGQAIQQTGQVQQLGVQEQQRQGQAEVASLQSGAREEAMDNVQRLAAIDAKAKRELYDDTLKFARDQNDRTLFNEQQLADYARTNARSEEEFRNYAQKAEMASKRRLELMETAYKKIAEDLDFRQREAAQKGDQKMAEEIAEMKKQTDARMARERARAANRAAAWQTGGTIVGGIAGAFGGPAGAAAGAGVGGAVGGMIGGM